MAGSFSAAFHQIVQKTINESTDAPVSGLTASTWHLFLTHTTLTDSFLITDTGRMAQGATDFHQNITNSTATWTVPTATSPSVFQNKVDIVMSTGNFAAPSQTTIKGWFAASLNSTSAGTVYGWGDVTPTQTVSTGNTVQFTTGQLVFTLGGGTAT